MSDSAANNWLLSHNQSVPALDIFHQQALQTLNRRTASLTDLADIISLDPGMSIALFEKVNARRSGSKYPRLDSVHSLLGLLGTPAITRFITHFKTVKSLEPGHAQCQAYYQLLSRNFHLMHQAAQLVELQGMDNTHEIEAAAYLHNAGEIYACLFDFKQYQAYQQEWLASKNQTVSAKSIFGFSFNELNQLITDKKHLPDLARESQQQAKSTGRKARTIQIAADITLQTEAGWHHAAVTKSIQNGGEFLNSPIEVLRKKILAASLNAARSFPIDDVFPAIARVILLPNINIPEPTAKAVPKPVSKPVSELVPDPVAEPVTKPITKSVSEPAPKPISKPITKPISSSTAEPITEKQVATPKRPTFGDKLKALMKSPDTTQAKIIGLTLNELSTEMNFSRVALMLISKDSSALSTRMSKGLEAESALSNLQIKMSQSGLIKNLLTKPQSLWVNSANFKKYEPLLPGIFRASSQSENFFLMSLFIGEKPIGLFFCDRTQKLDDDLYKTFKSNLLLSMKALTFLSQRTRNAKQPVTQ